MSRRSKPVTSTVVITYCDRCGAENNINAKAGTWFHLSWSDEGWHELDLCPKCYRKFRRWVGV